MSRKNWTDDKLLSRILNNKSDETYWDNVRVLHSRPSKELFLKCVELTKSIEPKKRIVGIDILSQFGFPRKYHHESVRLFFKLLKKETDNNVKASLLYAIGHNNEELTHSQIKQMITFKNSNVKIIRFALAYALGGVDDPLAINTLILLSEDKFASIRDWAIFGLAQIERNNEQIREALWKRINDKDDNTKMEAINGLAKRKDPGVKEIIKRELLHGEYGSLLFESIEELGDKEFLPLLQQNLKSAKADKEVNQVWVEYLEHCIDKLKNV
jgi:hypothetical protein